jgi:hypothetical protein
MDKFKTIKNIHFKLALLKEWDKEILQITTSNSYLTGEKGKSILIGFDRDLCFVGVVFQFELLISEVISYYYVTKTVEKLFHS